MAVGEVGRGALGEFHLSLLGRKVFICQRRKAKHFYIRKADSSFSKKNDYNHTCRMLHAKALIFYNLHAVYTFACILEGKPRLFSLCTTQRGWQGGSAFHTFLYCTYLYILTLSPCMNTDFVIFACFCFLPNWPLMGILLYRKKKKYACNFFPDPSLSIASERIRSEFTKKL